MLVGKVKDYVNDRLKAICGKVSCDRNYGIRSFHSGPLHYINKSHNSLEIAKTYKMKKKKVF